MLLPKGYRTLRSSSRSVYVDPFAVTGTSKCLISGSIRAHRKEILGRDKPGVEAPRTFHEIGFTVEGLVENASHCLGISSISKNNQGSLSREVPVLITLGEVLVHLRNNPYFEIVNCAGHRVPDFHEGLKIVS